MKKTVLLSYIALFLAFALPWMSLRQDRQPPESLPDPVQTAAPLPETEPSEAPVYRAKEAPELMEVLSGQQTEQTSMQEYLIGVVAAEMPASFHPEALKAQAVAARSYAIYSSRTGKHPEGQVCTDHKCCQAWSSSRELEEKWGDNYDLYLEKIRSAVEETHGEYLCWQGEAIFAAFHSSSAGFTENSGSIWAPLPYLVSVESPENAEHVPNYISSLSLSPLDFRDTLLHARPEADFTGEESTWIDQIRRDASGRVESAVLGGVELKGTELRSLFSLRSTAFTLENRGGLFVFTVTGYGHGVGMSQYGANVMAQQGAAYREILAHYYPGTELVGAG